MANFSDFFPTSNSSVVASPSDLPRNTANSQYLKIKTSKTTTVASESADFWTYYGRQYATVTQTSSTSTYTTIADVSSSNGGVLFHVIGGSQYYHVHNHQQYIKITLDGVVTEIGPINMATSQYRAFHPVLGSLLPFPPATSNPSQAGLFSNYERWFDNNSSYQQTKGFWASHASQAFTIPTPSEAELLPKVRFNSTLKVEVKGTNTSTYNGNKVGCAYKLY